MKTILVFLTILLMLLTVCSYNAPDEKSVLPKFYEVRIKIDNVATYIRLNHMK